MGRPSGLTQTFTNGSICSKCSGPEDTRPFVFSHDQGPEVGKSSNPSISPDPLKAQFRNLGYEVQLSDTPLSSVQRQGRERKTVRLEDVQRTVLATPRVSSGFLFRRRGSWLKACCCWSSGPSYPYRSSINGRSVFPATGQALRVGGYMGSQITLPSLLRVLSGFLCRPAALFPALSSGPWQGQKGTLGKLWRAVPVRVPRAML